MDSSAQKHCLEAWVRTTLGKAVAYANSLLGNLAHAEDVVQDCYCRLLQKKDHYNLEQDGVKLLFRSISNACLNWRKKENRYRQFADSDRDQEGDGLKSWHVPDLRESDPARLAMKGELENAIVQALAQLPTLQRAALELKSWGHSQQEVAEMLDITPTHAGVLIHRARQFIADKIQSQEESQST